MASSVEVIVVGLGAAGAATLYQLAKRGVRVLGIDRHHPPHALGSSHGHSRITRQAIGEGADYAPLAIRSHALWREIEAQTGQTLMLTTGCLVIGAADITAAPPGKPRFVRQTIEVAQRFSIPHEVLGADDIRRRFPMFSPREDELGCFEPGGGVLFPERCVAAQLQLAARHGAVIATGQQVTAIDQTGRGVRVTTDQGSRNADQIVVCAGPWLPGLLGGDFGRRLRLHRQVMHWFEPQSPAQFAPERQPVFIWMHGEQAPGWFYGFPLLPGSAGVKVAGEQFADTLAAPEAMERTVAAAEAADFHAAHISSRLSGITPRVVASAACLYTMAPDSRFIVSRDPLRQRIVVVSACSGHGFKHSAAIGEAVAQLTTDPEPPAILEPFALPQ